MILISEHCWFFLQQEESKKLIIKPGTKQKPIRCQRHCKATSRWHALRPVPAARALEGTTTAAGALEDKSTSQPGCLVFFFDLTSSFYSTAELWVKAEKPCENCSYGRCQRKGEEPHLLCRKERDQMSERKPWNDAPDMLPPVQVLVQHQKLTGDLEFQSGPKLVAMVFPSFLCVSGQRCSACYLLEGNEAMQLCLSLPFPSCGSIRCLHFPNVISSNFNLNLYNTYFPNALHCLSTERQVIDCYCYICLYY